ncbi:MAG: DNA replication/repair protein RecF [Candidatus Azobacteroides sp.]|nr:DNA replication/repair protein RecF [Candidatus Azobacteroides sp.]
MIIERISILNFKNIEEADLSFSPKMNYFFGNNGMGKTNLLDALFYLSFTKNHTNLLDFQLIKHEEEFCVLQGYYRNNETKDEVYCGIRHKQRKIFKRNKKEYDRLSEHIGLIPMVMVSPADTELIQGGSVERRKFADMIISQYDKEYLRLLIHYNKVLQQRNSLLKERTPDYSLFEILDEQLTSSGEIIHQKRKEFIVGFRPIFQKYYQAISDGCESVDLQYDSHLDTLSLSMALKEKLDNDKILGYTSVGIHKDDFLFLLGNHLIRKIGSQGQNKTYLIALKLAQFQFLLQKNTSVPILLLDDIFDKLDANRVERIIQLVTQEEFGQIFVTDTNRKYLDEILSGLKHDYKLFRVEEGKIKEL